MKKYILDSCINNIKKYYPDYNEDKLAEIRYGLEGIYLTIPKAIILSVVALALGIFKEMIIILLFFNALRAFAYGLHATKSWICLLSSLIIYITVTIIAIKLIFPISIKILIVAICIITFCLYAPADTEKHPIIKKKKRMFCKGTTIIIGCIYSFIALYTSNNFICNCLLMAMTMETLFIMPITYKLFKIPYNNYKTYLKTNN